MSHRHQRPFGHSYRNLITTVQESASDLADQQTKRDQDRLFYEKQKVVLLLLIFTTLWIMFGLLWGKLGDLRPASPSPVPEQPIPIHYL